MHKDARTYIKGTELRIPLNEIPLYSIPRGLGHPYVQDPFRRNPLEKTNRYEAERLMSIGNQAGN